MMLETSGVNIICDGIKSLKEYKIAKEVEITERKRIEAAVKCFCDKLETQKIIILKVLEQRHIERMEIILLAKDNISVAVKNNDPVMVRCFTDMLSIVVQQEHNPNIKDLPSLKEIGNEKNLR